MEVFIRNFNYRIFMIANIVSALGSTLFSIVFVIYARHMPNPTLAISLASFVGVFPMFLDILIGYLSDQVCNHYQQQMVNRLIQGLLFLVMGVLLMGNVGWVTFIALLLMNALCSLIGTYNGYGAFAIIKDIVSSSDIAEAEGFETGISSTLEITGGLIGAALLSVFNYHYSLFAFLNSVSFFMASMLLFWVRKNFSVIPSSHVLVEKYTGLMPNISKFFHQMRLDFAMLKTFPEITKFIGVFSAINLFDAGQEVLLNLSLVKQQQLIFVNYGYTVALVGMVGSIGAILGSFLPGRITKHLKITVGIFFIYGAYGLLIPNILFLKNKYLLLVLIAVSSLLLGVLNPQVQSVMVTKLPENMIGSIMGSFYTIIQATIPLGSAIFSAVANVLSLNISWCSLLAFDMVTLFVWIAQVYGASKRAKSQLRRS